MKHISWNISKYRLLLYVLGILLLISKILIIFFQGNGYIFYPDEGGYYALAHQIINFHFNLSKTNIPVYNWGYDYLNAILYKITNSYFAIKIFNVFICFLLQIYWGNFILKQKNSYPIFVAFVPIFFFGFNWFSLYNLKDTLVILIVVWTLINREKNIKFFSGVAALYIMRVYFGIIAFISILIERLIMLPKRTKKIIVPILFITLLLLIKYYFNPFAEIIHKDSEASMQLIAQRGFGMEGIDVLSPTGFIISFGHFFLTPLPLHWMFSPLDLLKVDSIMFILILGRNYKLILHNLKKRENYFLITFIILIGIFYAFFPILSIPRHKYSIILPLLLLLKKDNSLNGKKV